MITLSVEWSRDLASYQLGRKYGKFGVVEYVDSSYAGDIDNRKLITRYYFCFGGGIVTWCSKQQHTVSTSISEAKYVAISHRIREGV